MEGISSFRNRIEMPFILMSTVNGQRTTNFGYAFFSRRDAEERKDILIEN
jgi:hypothetical protein